jgi:hypothetical protein
MTAAKIGSRLVTSTLFELKGTQCSVAGLTSGAPVAEIGIGTSAFTAEGWEGANYSLGIQLKDTHVGWPLGVPFLQSMPSL